MACVYAVLIGRKVPIRREFKMATNLRGRQPRNKRVEVRLTEDEFENLDWMATESKLTVSQIIRAALGRFDEYFRDEWERRNDPLK